MRNNNRHYYGFYWTYGVGTWCDDAHRSSVDASLAVTEMRRVVNAEWAARGGHYGESANDLPTEQLIAEYARYTAPDHE